MKLLSLSVNKPREIPIPIYVLVVAVLGYVGVEMRYLDWGGVSAFVWPTTEVFPYLERLTDSNFAPNDFWLNAFSERYQPKHLVPNAVFFLQNLLGFSHYYDIYFLFKFWIVILHPVAAFCALATLLPGGLNSLARHTGQATLVVGVLLLGAPWFWSFVTIAWWPPMKTDVVPATISQVFGFVGIYCYSVCRFRILPILCFSVSALLHPLVGVSMLALNFCGRSFSVDELKKIFIFVVLVLGAPAILTLSVNAYDGGLSGAEVYEFVVKNYAPFHWKFSDFGTFLGISWWKISFLNISSLLVVGSLSLIVNRALKLSFRLAVIGIIVYAVVIVAHYVFVEVLKSKHGIYVAPIRMVIIVAWIQLLAVASLVSEIIGLISIGPNRQKAWDYFSFLSNSTRFNKTIVFAITLLFGSLGRFSFIILCVGIWVRPMIQDDPFDTVPNKTLKTWVMSTDKDAVFLTSPELSEQVLLFGRRSTFNHLIPFNEHKLVEWNERNTILLGDYDSWKSAAGNDPVIVGKSLGFASLTPSKLVDASRLYQIDFIVLLQNAVSPIAAEFFEEPPIVEIDGQIYIWRLDQFQK